MDTEMFRALTQLLNGPGGRQRWRLFLDRFADQLDDERTILKFWEALGHDAADKFLADWDDSRPLLPQLTSRLTAHCAHRGEDVQLEHRGSVAIVHEYCHWFSWYRQYGASKLCRQGCDTWFQTVITDVNDALDTRLEIQTTCTQSDGSHRCSRHLGSLEAYAV